MPEFVVVIPSRYESTRLPGKSLRNIAGRPMIQHVFERGSESGAGEVVVATDDERIADAVEAFGGTVCMTGRHHQSGTERIAEVADLCDWDDETIVVNLQGDEPTMPPALIDEAATLLEDSGADIATLASPVQSIDDLHNPNVVKVVRDASGLALYFSRAPIPFPRDDATNIGHALQHHGIYAYRCRALRAFVAAEASPLETIEQLELGMSIAVGIPSARPGAGVDTEADLSVAERVLAGGQP